MLTPYFRDADTTSLNLTSRFAAKLNISDTASMLTNYLRTGTAASTYLPLTGGTLSGSLDINTNNGSNSFQDSTLKVTYNQSSLGVNQNVTGIYSSVNTTGYTSTGILSEASTIYTTAIGVKGKATQSDINGPGVAYGIVGEIAASGSGSNGSTYAGYFNNTSTVGGNNYGLFVNTASGGDYGIYQTGSGINYLGSNTSIGGTLGVTGATTLSAPLTVNSSAVFNEGSADSDFRVESDGNANMVFVDASTDNVGIGTNAPDKTLHVNGEVKIATVTATPTSLLGKDGSNVVGELGLGTGMSIGSGILSVQAAGASATGLVTSFGSQTFGGNKTFNGTVTLKSATGTADTVIGRNSTGQIVNLTLGSGLSLSGGTLSASDNANSSLFISRTGTTVEFVEDLTIYSVIYLKLNNNSTITVTLPTASLTTNKSITIKNIGSGAVNSNASNVEPLNSSSLSSVILTSGGGKFTTLVSDGTNWIKMTGN
jgi:trimeric autotransporter adhesin